MRRIAKTGLASILAVSLLFAAAKADEPAVDIQSVRLAIEDLMVSFPDEFTQGQEYLERANRIGQLPEGPQRTKSLRQLQREALLNNPLLDFNHLAVVRRENKGDRGLPANWQGNERLKGDNYTNELVLLSRDRLNAPLQTLFHPPQRRFVGDMDLHFDGKRLLFSMPGQNGRWQIHEIEIDPEVDAPATSRELATIPDDDVDNYDACYLPDGNIIFTSTATYTGVPCVKGNSHVANIYHLDVDTGAVRRLTFDQDHNWNPTLLNNGRVLYLRWEYSDLPHFVARILFHMNPDGTNQAEYYGSGSYWPNSFFYPRAIPDHPTQVVGIVTGHHGARRAGELVILDPALGRREAEGVVQRIPGRGKVVEPIILDKLVDASWPKFLHPYPLSSKYFLVSMQPSARDSWGVYLVDVFDNLVLLRNETGFDLFEPTPVKRRTVPPTIPDRVDSENKEALVYLEDIYQGNGLKGVPRGTVKNLRLVTYHFAYRGMGGQQDPLGLDGPWDIKCVLGTVPVEPDGSALFHVPANMPISFQPLDEEGKAIQLMRSWSTAMPGEEVSCTGCHERQNMAPPSQPAIALGREPSRIAPWYGPPRGFSFQREVEPVVRAHCAGCHSADAPSGTDPDAPPIDDAYMFVRRFVRTPTIEPDMHMLEPYEYHADTSELVRILRAGHYGVELDDEAWDRLITWIDLNTPRYGTWTANVGRQRMGNSVQRRRDLMQRYAGIEGIVEDPDTPITAATDITPIATPSVESAAPTRHPVKILAVASLDDGEPQTRSVPLRDGSELHLIRIPSGAFSVGNSEIRIEQPFWIGRCEITNRQFALCDPDHDSRLEPLDFLHFDPQRRGSPLNGADQPVTKVSWRSAVAYCRWLARETNLHVDLPTESEWEWACRAGTETPLWFGHTEAEFVACENLADAQFHASISGSVVPWRPAVADQDDGHKASAPIGSFGANPWGLHDMHGNVAEWTASNVVGSSNVRTARGGSWSDRPKWATASMRREYLEFQKVYNVGFRVVVRNE